MHENTTVNTSRSSKWQVSFSNIPTIADVSKLAVVEQFVQNVTLPDYSLQELYSTIQGANLRHPISRHNENMAPLTMTLKMSEGGENYAYLLKWMLYLRYPKDNVTTEHLRDFYCSRLTVHMLDNQKREVVRLFFTKVWPTNISSFSLDSGVDSETSFTLNVSYEELGIDLIDIHTT